MSSPVCMNCARKDAEIAQLKYRISELEISRDQSRQDKERWMKAYMQSMGLNPLAYEQAMAESGERPNLHKPTEQGSKKCTQAQK